MSATHLHLLINHLPVMGGPIAIVLLAWALIARSRDLTRAGLILVVVCGIGGYVTKESGERAHRQLASLPWFDRGIFREHDEAADWAFATLAIAGVAAAVALVRMRGGRPARVETGIVLGLSLLAFAATAKTALAGGKIRHEEVRSGFVFPAPAPGHDE
jgi:hypothetical protein